MKKHEKNEMIDSSGDSDGGDAAGTMSRGAGDKVQKHLPLMRNMSTLVEREWPLSNDAAAAVISCGCIAAGIRIDRDRHRHRHRLGLGEDSGEEGE